MLLNLLLGILILVAIAMTGLVLLQRSEGGALGIGGGNQFMTARGAGNILTKGTQILGVIFFLLCLTITFLTGRQSGLDSITDRIDLKIDLNQKAPALGAPPPPSSTLPAAPAEPAPGAPAPASPFEMKGGSFPLPPASGQ